MRIALVCDSLSAYGGAERVIEEILAIYPQADLFATVDVLPAGQRGFLGERPVRTSFLQRLPMIQRFYRHLLPLWPLAVEQFDVTAYDLVISSHHAVAYGVLTRPDQTHVSYVHSPMRYAWDLQHEYLRETGLDRGPASWIVRKMLHTARIWDFAAAQRPDMVVANSRFVAQRLWRTHRRKAEVLHPPVAVHGMPPRQRRGREGYYLTVGRLVPYKRAELLARAFARMPDRRLKIVGNGPDRRKLEALRAPNVELLSGVPTSEVRRLMAGAEAFMFAGVEDFGITPVEAQAAGAPVIAYGVGGLAETVLDEGHARPTGLFFREQTVEAVIAAVEQFERTSDRFTEQNCVDNAARFSSARFRTCFSGLVSEALASQRNPSVSERGWGPSPRQAPVLADTGMV